jgi:transposase InsO family protein
MKVKCGVFNDLIIRLDFRERWHDNFRPEYFLVRIGHSQWHRPLNRELVHRCEFAARAEARAAIFEWIEVFYNREPFHSALAYQSPVDFETQLN